MQGARKVATSRRLATLEDIMTLPVFSLWLGRTGCGRTSRADGTIPNTSSGQETNCQLGQTLVETVRIFVSWLLHRCAEPLLNCYSCCGETSIELDAKYC